MRVSVALLIGLLCVGGAGATVAMMDNSLRVGIDQEGTYQHAEALPACANANPGSVPQTHLRFMPTACDLASLNGIHGAAHNESGQTWHDCTGWVECSGPGNMVTMGVTAVPAAGDKDLYVLEIEMRNLTIVVEHRWSAQPDVLEVTVTHRNDGPNVLDDVRYRRTQPFRVMPEFASFMSLEGPGPIPAPIAYTSTLDANMADPTRPPDVSFLHPNAQCPQGIRLGPGSVSGGAYFADHGPCGHGALVEVDIGTLAPGDQRVFTMYLGAAGESGSWLAGTGLRGALRDLGVEFFFLAEPQSDPVNGAPNAAAWAFKGLLPPVPDFEWDPMPACTGRPVTFTDTTVANNDIEQGTWYWGDGTTSAWAPGTTDHAFPAAGTYTVRLNLTDINQWSGETDMQVTVVDCFPTAAFSCMSSRDPYLRVRFFDQSFATDAGIVSWQWDLGDGTTVSGQTDFEHDYATRGTRSVTLVVTDDFGATATVTRPCTALLNLPPAWPEQDVETIYAGAPYERYLRAHDPDGDALSYAFGPGTPPGATWQGNLFAWTPTEGQLGLHGPIHLAADDGEFLAGSSFWLRVLAAPRQEQPVSMDADGDGAPDASDPCPATAAPGTGCDKSRPTARGKLVVGTNTTPFRCDMADSECGSIAGNGTCDVDCEAPGPAVLGGNATTDEKGPLAMAAADRSLPWGWLVVPVLGGLFWVAWRRRRERDE